MRGRKPSPPNILQVAREQLAGAPSCAVFEMLFDAALRSVRGVDRDDPRLNEELNKALDLIYAELTGRGGVGDVRAPVMEAGRVAGIRLKAPALKP